MKKKFLIMLMVMIVTVLIGGCTNSDNKKIDRIGIIGAMDEEVNPLKDALEGTKTNKIAGMEFYEGKLSGKDVVVVKCGMGKVNAGICAHTLINDYGCIGIINTGVAGSLDNQLNIGDIVVSTDAVQHDFNVEKIGFAKGEIPYTGLYAFPADETVKNLAVEAAKAVVPNAHVYEGRVCSGDQFISTNEQKEKIKADFGGMCAEMEGAAIAQACYLNNTPFVVIRAISDKSDASQAVEFETFKKEAAHDATKIIKYMVERM